MTASLRREGLSRVGERTKTMKGGSLFQKNAFVGSGGGKMGG